MARIPQKRELAALLLLHERGPLLNYGIALDILRSEMCASKKVAASILRRLRRLGFIKIEARGGEILVRAEDPSMVLKGILYQYLGNRKARCRK
ncbi:MAG: hypothetical protein F7B95_03140 [Desulfurococcales archaeon]|nr:hypothetical protein [Desulfurococcales archaeon]